LAQIRRLKESDIESIVALRREALRCEPEAFSASPGSDVGRDREFLGRILGQAAAQAMFGALDPQLVGMVGVYREEGDKQAHKAGVWGMYVQPSHRGRGLGASLLAAAIGFARSMPGVTHLHLSASDTAGAARRLYERMGFQTWGIEPASLQVNGRLVDVHHMVLPLARSKT
jgi:ribosomal protein S18 acetylase RimI-like enzyme